MRTHDEMGERSAERVDKEAVVKKAIDPQLRINGETPEDLVGKVKWALGLAKGEENYSQEATAAQLDGLVRGFVAERISNLIPLNDLDFAYPTGNSDLVSLFGRLRLVPPADLSSLVFKRENKYGKPPVYWDEPVSNPDSKKGTKGGLLQRSVADTLNVPKAVLDLDYSSIRQGMTRDEIGKLYMAEIIREYGGTDSVDYNKTSIPDAFLATGQGDNICGACEVKAYTPTEFHLYVDAADRTSDLVVDIDDATLNGASGKVSNHYRGKMKLGFDIEGEQRMVDILADAQNARRQRELTGVERQEAQDPYGQIIPVVMRVLDDVSDQDIEKLMKLAGELGYPNFVVQKLPFTSEDMARLVPLALQAVRTDLLEGSKFSKREKKVLRHLMGESEVE